MQTLPFSSDYAQTFTIQLGDTKYDVACRYNTRAGFWTVDMAETVTGKILFTGSPLVLGVDILAPYNFNIGSIFTVDTTGQGIEAGADDLGARVVVYWSAPGETA